MLKHFQNGSKTLSGYAICSDGKCAGVFEEIYSEYYPVGLYKVTVKGIKKEMWL